MAEAAPAIKERASETTTIVYVSDETLSTSNGVWSRSVDWIAPNIYRLRGKFDIRAEIPISRDLKLTRIAAEARITTLHENDQISLAICLQNTATTYTQIGKILTLSNWCLSGDRYVASNTVPLDVFVATGSSIVLLALNASARETINAELRVELYYDTP